MTEQEKQEIIDGLLEEIRANGLDYSGQTITFPNAFNVTQTERQNVKIPAIDERSATPVHGNVDLEALLTAYGLTKVEEIASDISTNYMKKTADSNLNMNGYSVSGVKMTNSYTPFGYTAPYAELPQLSYETLGLADNSSFEEFMTAWTLKIIEIYGTAVNVRGKVLVDSRTGYGDIWGWVHSGSDSLGATSFCCIYQDYNPGRAIFTYRIRAVDSIHVEQFDTNYDVNGKRIADLDMGGYTIGGIEKLMQKGGTVGSALNGNIVPMPYYPKSTLGADGSVADYLQKLLKQICSDYPNLQHPVFVGAGQPTSAGFFMCHINHTSGIDATTGLPSYADGIYVSYGANDSYRFYCSNGTFYIRRQSDFDTSNTSLDNRINAIGWNYIRYENGLQIYWGNVYGTERPCHATFSPPFTEVFYINATGRGATNFMYFGATANVTTTGMDIYRFSISTNSNIFEANDNGARIEYLVIGKWR